MLSTLYIVLVDNDSCNLNYLIKIQLGLWHLAPSLEDWRAVFVVVFWVFFIPTQPKKINVVGLCFTVAFTLDAGIWYLITASDKAYTPALLSS